MDYENKLLKLSEQSWNRIGRFARHQFICNFQTAGFYCISMLDQLYFFLFLINFIDFIHFNQFSEVFMVFYSSFHVSTTSTNRKNAIHYENFLFTPGHTQLLRQLSLICFEKIKYDLKNLSSISFCPLCIGNNFSHTFESECWISSVFTRCFYFT